MLINKIYDNPFLREEAGENGTETGGEQTTHSPLEASIGDTTPAPQETGDNPDTGFQQEEQTVIDYLKDEESLNKYRQQYGIPTEADKYELALDEGITIPQEILDTLKKSGVANGISQKAMSNLVRDYMAAQQNEASKMEAEIQSQRDALEKEWGADTDANASLAQRAAAIIIERSGVDPEFLKTSGIGDHPQMYRMFHEISKMIGEGKVHGVENSSITTGISEARRIESDPSHPLHEAYMNYNHPNHKYANELYDRYLGIKH